MRIGMIGAGHIGGTLARLFAAAGHEVGVSNSRDPDTLRSLVEELGSNAHAGTPAEVADFAEVLVVSIPFGRYQLVPIAESAGKVVIDTNNYYPERDGRFEDLDAGHTTSSELLQTHLGEAHVVKAFNTINWRVLADRAAPESEVDRVAVPIAGDDPDAKRIVSELIEAVGFDAVDVGGLVEGRHLQPGSQVYRQALPAAEVRQRLGLGTEGRR